MFQKDTLKSKTLWGSVVLAAWGAIVTGLQIPMEVANGVAFIILAVTGASQRDAVAKLAKK
jgi:hypothetical protein